MVGVAVLAMDLARQESMVEDKRVLLFSLVFSFLEASGMMLLARGLPRKAATGEDGELRL